MQSCRRRAGCRVRTGAGPSLRRTCRFLEERGAVKPPKKPLFRPARAAPRLTADLAPSDMLAFDDGAPDIRHVPIDILARAYREGLRSTLQRRRLGYGGPRGSGALRAS